MHCLLEFLLALLPMILLSEIAVEASDIYRIQNEVAEFNLTCIEDSCGYTETDSLSSRSCHCNIQCTQLGTCCVDSYYAVVSQPKLKPTCRSVYKGKHYYIVDQCAATDSAWANLCNEEWNGEDDVQKLVPVTSLLTSITYKNYYCFRCHESSDEFAYWIVKLVSEFGHDETLDEDKTKDAKIVLTYHKDADIWMAIYDENVGYFPVNLTLDIPQDIYRLVHGCEPDVISDCSDEWLDGETRNACLSYMALKEVERNGSVLKYRNVHCALCNFESLSDIRCRNIPFKDFAMKQPFSFTFLLDINRTDGDVVGKIQKCLDDHIWDPYTKQCRKLSCALPGFKIKNWKCVKE